MQIIQKLIQTKTNRKALELECHSIFQEDRFPTIEWRPNHPYTTI